MAANPFQLVGNQPVGSAEISNHISKWHTNLLMCCHGFPLKINSCLFLISTNLSISSMRPWPYSWQKNVRWCSKYPSLANFRHLTICKLITGPQRNTIITIRGFSENKKNCSQKPWIVTAKAWTPHSRILLLVQKAAEKKKRKTFQNRMQTSNIRHLFFVKENLNSPAKMAIIANVAC